MRSRPSIPPHRSTRQSPPLFPASPPSPSPIQSDPKSNRTSPSSHASSTSSPPRLISPNTHNSSSRSPLPRVPTGRSSFKMSPGVTLRNQPGSGDISPTPGHRNGGETTPSLDHNPSILKPVADARMIRGQVCAEPAGEEDARVEMCTNDHRVTLMHPHIAIRQSLEGQRNGVQGTVVQRVVESIPARTPTSRPPVALHLPPNGELSRRALSQTGLGHSIPSSAEHEELSFIRASKEDANPQSRTPSRQSGATGDARDQAIKIHNRPLPRLLSTGKHSVQPYLSVLLDILRVRMKRNDVPSLVNTAATSHLITILGAVDYGSAPALITRKRDAVNLLDFLMHIWRRDLLRRMNLQDTDRRMRCLIVELSATVETIPESVFIDFRDVEQVEPSTFASGRSADVYHGLCHGKRVALRRFRTTGLSEDMCRETLIWWTLKHQNVLPCLGVYFTSWPGQLTSVSPFMENGTLWDWRTRAMRFVGDIERLILGVAEGLQYLHNEGVIHGDLHGDNVLLDSNGQPKISDYGLARHSDSVHTGISGLAYAFAAPELIQDDDSFAIRTEKTDIFSFGRLYYQIHYGRRPFDGKGQYSISHKVKKGIRPKKMAEPILSDRAWVLMSQCWQTNPTRRPTMSIIVKTMQSWPWPLA